jgi:hypothetical protein
MRMPTAPTFFVLAALVCLSACVATLECGTWAFSGTVHSQPDSFPLSSAFTFTPATCGKTCDCQTDAMIQITWVYDTVSRTNLYAGSGDAARADANGWNVDRIDGEGYGYYSLINDGVTFASFWNTTGSNGTPTTLFDAPGGWPNNTYFYALDVVACVKSSGCKNKILGYYFWSWSIDNSGNASKFIISPAWKNLDGEFQSALAAWNAWAPTSGAQPGTSGIPGEPSLLNAVNFPALSDL